MEPARVIRGLPVVGLTVIAAALLAAPAQAQPSVRIRAGAQIELDGIRLGTLYGRLLDDRGEPIADRVVVIEAEPDAADGRRRTAVRTDEGGAFSVPMSGTGASVPVRASFGGDREHAPVQRERTLDRSRADLQLRFVEPRSAYLDLDADGHDVLVRATSPLGGAGLALSLADDRGRVLASGTTDQDGGLRVHLRSAQLGEPGAGALTARSPGDETRAEASSSLAIVRFRRTTLALSAAHDRDPIELHGALRAGGPLAGKAIGLFDGNRHVATVLTDRAGRFRYAIGASADGQAHEWHVQARFASDAAWLGSSRSSVIAVRVEPPHVPSVLWLTVPALALGLIAAWLLRTPASERSAETRSLPVGIHAQPRRSSGPGARRDVGGNVRDARTGEAIEDARIVVDGGAGPPLMATAQAGGAFRLVDLHPASYRLTVSAPGYGEVTAELSVPHRGQWADVQVRLPSLRDAALEAYKPVAVHRLPAPELWGRWTVREVLASATNAGRASPALERLSALVERIAYGRAIPEPADMVEVERAREAALNPFGGMLEARRGTRDSDGGKEDGGTRDSD